MDDVQYEAVAKKKILNYLLGALLNGALFTSNLMMHHCVMTFVILQLGS